jgi:acyl-CoA thioester hydrolase
MEFLKQIQIRWSDLDPNFHVRHSVYYDYGAFVRICFFNEHGLTPAIFQQYHFGPILFREGCTFRRELHFGDDITINLMLTKARADHSRWSMRHTIVKQGNILAAEIDIDGAFIDTHTRKLTVPPAFAHSCLNAIPRSPDFEVLGG